MNDNFELQVRWNGGKATVPEWTIQCDFDGTISLQDVTDTLLQRHGMPGWEDLEEAWERGEIGSRECMSGQVALLDMSVAELREALEQVHVDPGFVRFVDQARQLGIGVQVVSDGLDYAIQVILAREGMGDLPIVANRLLPAGPRRWKLETPWSRPDCASANCKCGQLAGQRAAGKRVLYVGDGSSDFCVSGKAEHVLAKAKLLDYCRANGIVHSAFVDFDEALSRLPEILSGQNEESTA
ncbi:MtnX-like HAD-IB family phosphatase [Achromobacter sp. Marseille-Q0513]|uniref:MtnX-like HAD-IB family phosphatase n=1 Tax=Achromobacter sp. Marseille-Q0513 TaxID=2829161 RepID=UPI001B94A3EA|nr:MtnX-like HAD-IB family phosphatase [Achromobacter sp. Marseille-Q0513]MBR8652473.1 MtnX-like HAD-IB family phosphatase [Achromobacter sp. Marseille-Q0513]